MMTVFAVLLCVLLHQAIGQTKGTQSTKAMPVLSSATVLAPHRTISENSDFYVTCSTYGRNITSMIFVYLCKDSLGIRRMTLKPDKNDITFHISRVDLHHSGNYSCVYSNKSYTLSDVTQRGDNTIQILVIHIAVVGPSAVHEGDNIEFRCTVPSSLHTLGECPLVYSYLRKNGTVLLVQAFNVSQMKATFSIKGAVMRDSGHYSCVVLPTMCIQEQEHVVHGKNTVLLEVKEKMDLASRLIISAGVIITIFLGLCLWWISNKPDCPAMCTSGLMSQETNTLGEQDEPDREDLEAQDEEEDSFSLEDEEMYNQGADGSDFEVVYSLAGM
ncbi:uncharacterized protein LOC114433088 isoform X2 [Parambassis ranga]|uniref:Uncharacterized protein LOC114433088 isoform X2 n=1 Tax=Parambassis ranga TaxID=210632 RepID=A0A6P7I307_9TELE|nr:uncharacterized protein LOC114433088 isoform X2 [Parambassis ranga]